MSQFELTTFGAVADQWKPVDESVGKVMSANSPPRAATCEL
jgi:hypothetical protein